MVAALWLPLITKPLAVESGASSHDMSLAYRWDGMAALHPSLVLQQFVNHGGSEDVSVLKRKGVGALELWQDEGADPDSHM